MTCSLHPHEEIHGHEFCHAKCDDCGDTAWGTMFYAESATGWLAPVLFICEECERNPWRRARLAVARVINEACERALHPTHNPREN